MILALAMESISVRAWPWRISALPLDVLLAATAVGGHAARCEAHFSQPPLVSRGLALAILKFGRARYGRRPGDAAEQLLDVLEEFERLLGEWIRLAADSQIESHEDALPRSLEIAAQLDRLGSRLAWLLEEHPEVLAMLQATEEGRAGGSSGDV